MASFTVVDMITLLAAIGASSGFWAWIMKRQGTKSAQTRLLLGLAHDRIIFLGMMYIDRGWLSKDEFEDFDKYLWAPYSEFGGNGIAEKVYKDVCALPLIDPRRRKESVSVDVHVEQQGVN